VKLEDGDGVIEAIKALDKERLMKLSELQNEKIKLRKDE